uniref:Retrotransposon domain containing protein n=1 Tax=Haemonchus contortus TaxID=6289 RepID=W6N9Z0_HAECO
MGYLVSGRPKLENKNVFQVSQQLQDEASEWEKLWSMDLIQQYTVWSTGNKVPQKEDKEKMGKDIDKDNITLTADGPIQKVDRIVPENEYELGQLLKIVPDQNNSCPQGKNTMEVQAKENDEMIKRALTSAIASIYDPLGWILPLLYRSETFLQGLWKNQYRWDQRLPTSKGAEWINIVDEVQFFEKKISRYKGSKNETVILTTFADASTSSMATCVYLSQNNRSFLFMAKSKLLPLQGQYTIPKFELNAPTLAMRLSNQVVNELKDSLNILAVYLFTDSAPGSVATATIQYLLQGGKPYTDTLSSRWPNARTDMRRSKVRVI